ncbi:uncharacterized protein LOC129610860 [Condylostylus longicornis]|uniref:uncharacterized protein LOC129610860 n=1 Tax=Condylostylus longicornis TaxID=2530218 RepID=UPI00244E3FCE|nr:uncharacterized protein LOC129610860 [Condylostylus longicornis]
MITLQSFVDSSIQRLVIELRVGFIGSKEATPQGFIRLLIMRLIYGIATQMGVEDRISGLFNGAFVPPNADDDDFSFDFGLSDNSGGGLFGGGGIEDLFDF